MKEFSNKVLKYALEKGISMIDLKDNYQQLIVGYYKYANHILFQDELSDYMYDYRTELFYNNKKATFWLLLDFTVQDILGSIPMDITESSKKPDEKISETSDLNEVYFFLKKRLLGLNEEFYNKIIERSINLFLENDKNFVESMWSQILDYLKIDKGTSSHIESMLEEFYLFQDAFEEYCDENDYEY